MTIYDEKLKEIVSYFEGLNDYFKHEIDMAPEGRLSYQNNRGKIQFLHDTTHDGKRERPGINKEPDLIKALARKEFNTKAFDHLSDAVDLLKAAFKQLSMFDYETILKSMTSAYSLLPEDYFFDCGNREIIYKAEGTDDNLYAKVHRHEEWGKMPYKEYWGYPENKTKITSRGQRMRSLSEVLIAETLYKHLIPFHYEEIIETDGKRFAPDFTFEGWDYKKFYLDYFGMMGDAKYAKRNFLKLDDYYDIGLIPGENLIVVFNSKGLMNAKVIEAIVENEIIPRL